jgi:membrane protease YdiL (CAAX protease family)
LKYQDGATCIATYNEFRDFGYWCDPLGFYRLKLHFLHPSQPWEIRDFLGLISLLIFLAILIVIPYMWILPIHFIGHRWNFVSHEKPYQSLWGLKMFWLVSAGYLIASVFACMAEPETLYSIFNSSNFDSDTDMTSENRGFEFLIFIILMALLGMAAMYKINPKVLLSNSWSIKNCILTGVGVLFVYKIIVGIYLHIGTSFGISIDDLASIPNVLLASRQEFESVISTFGKGTSLLLICLLVPVYEEIIFRGVVLDSCQRYLNFNTANIIQATLFALIHMSLFLIPVFFLFGILTGIMRRKSGGLLPGIVFHSLNNLLALVVLFFR